MRARLDGRRGLPGFVGRDDHRGGSPGRHGFRLRLKVGLEGELRGRTRAGGGHGRGNRPATGRSLGGGVGLLLGRGRATDAAKAPSPSTMANSRSARRSSTDVPDPSHAGEDMDGWTSAETKEFLKVCRERVDLGGNQSHGDKGKPVARRGRKVPGLHQGPQSPWRSRPSCHLGFAPRKRQEPRRLAPDHPVTPNRR